MMLQWPLKLKEVAITDVISKLLTSKLFKLSVINLASFASLKAMLQLSYCNALAESHKVRYYY